MPRGPFGEAGWPFDSLGDTRPDDDPAAPTPRLDQALGAEGRERPTEGVPGHAEASTELALRREPTPRNEASSEDVGLDPAKHLNGGEIVPMDVPAPRHRCLEHVLTLVHRRYSVAHVNGVVPDSRRFHPAPPGARSGAVPTLARPDATALDRADERLPRLLRFVEVRR
jgi:hypothetical protein